MPKSEWVQTPQTASWSVQYQPLERKKQEIHEPQNREQVLLTSTETAVRAAADSRKGCAHSNSGRAEGVWSKV